MAESADRDRDARLDGLSLLWDRPRSVARGRRPGLSLRRIAEAGVAIADGEGLDAVTMRRVAGELGTGTMSLYRYVRHKDDLVDLMTDLVLGEHEERDLAPRHWRDRLRASAHADWEMYQRHLWVLQTTMSRPPLGPNAVRGMEMSLQGLDGLGLEISQMVFLIGVVDGYTRGAALHLVNEQTAQRRTGLTLEEWLDSQDQVVLTKIFSSGEYPLLQMFASEEKRPDAERDFAAGLELILDGVEGFVQRS
ncbi:MAG: TetR/AcrR family transcriptional regulator C-terminal domain-containing protein [Pseudonocardia sp.]